MSFLPAPPRRLMFCCLVPNQGQGGETFTRYQDKLYGSWELNFTEHLHARMQLSVEPANRLFGGGNAAFLALF